MNKRIKKQAIKLSQDVVLLKQIEVQEMAISKWDGILPTVTGGAIPFLDINDISGKEVTN